jgi:tRNA 2-thiouridine synthesizing protein A
MSGSEGDAVTDAKAALPSPEVGETRLDLRGLNCPLPVLRARKALRQIEIGEALVLECTDPLTIVDVPHLAAETGNELAAQEREGEVYRYRIVRRR